MNRSLASRGARQPLARTLAVTESERPESAATGHSVHILPVHSVCGACTYWRFNDPLRFVTTPQSYTVWTVTLYEVSGGNAPTTQISPSAFPAP
jgi:hypothetical protein